MKKQVVVIHGGETFDTYEHYLAFLKEYQIDFEHMSGKGWKGALPEELGEAYEVIAPRMPNAMNAKYAEWKIYFEKYLPYLKSGVLLIGHSLGGIFLAKYLSEQAMPVKVGALYLVAAPYAARTAEYSLADFTLGEDLGRIEAQCDSVFLYHSTDDPIVPFADFETYHSRLSRAVTRQFTDRGHFDQEAFPELVADIRSIT